MPKTAIGLMAKFPQAGMVKTRLAATVGSDRALRIYEKLLQSILDTCAGLSADQFLRSIYVTPLEFVPVFAERYPGLDLYRAQSGADLGERMQQALDELLDCPGVDAAMLIGADIPDLSAELIARATTLLGAADLVLGPTVDGGYYLIGMTRLHRELFTGVEWGSAEVLSATRTKAEQLGLRLALLPELRDLDEAGDLEYFSEYRAMVEP